MVAAPNYNFNYNSSIKPQPLMPAAQLSQVQGNFNQQPTQLPNNQFQGLPQSGPLNSQLLSHLQGITQNANNQAAGQFQNAYTPANTQQQFNYQNTLAGLGNQAYGQMLGQYGNAMDNQQQMFGLTMSGLPGLMPGLNSLLGGLGGAY